MEVALKDPAYYLTMAMVPFRIHTAVYELLNHLARRYISWSSSRHRLQLLLPFKPRQEIFSGCIEFLEVTEILLQSKPKYDHVSYFAGKKIYVFNLQAINDWSGQFIYAATGYTSSTHDSTAFKNCILYRERSTYMSNDEYLPADKAYQFDNHVFNP